MDEPDPEWEEFQRNRVSEEGSAEALAEALSLSPADIFAISAEPASDRPCRSVHHAADMEVRFGYVDGKVALIDSYSACEGPAGSLPECLDGAAEVLVQRNYRIFTNGRLRAAVPVRRGFNGGDAEIELIAVLDYDESGLPFALKVYHGGADDQLSHCTEAGECDALAYAKRFDWPTRTSFVQELECDVIELCGEPELTMTIAGSYDPATHTATVARGERLEVRYHFESEPGLSEVARLDLPPVNVAPMTFEMSGRPTGFTVVTGERTGETAFEYGPKGLERTTVNSEVQSTFEYDCP